MPGLIALLGIIAAVGYWLYRIREAGDTAREALDMANDVRLAARRFAYKRKHKTHPIDGCDDARLTAAAIMVIAAETDGAITANEQKVMIDQAATTFNCGRVEAEEMIVFGRWLAAQGNNRDETFRRLFKRMISLGGPETVGDMIPMITAVADVDGNSEDESIQDLIQRLKNAIN